MEDIRGARLAATLARAYGTMVESVIEELERRGHVGVRAVHEFALRAIEGGATSASSLAVELGVTKQAAAKTVAALEQLGYVERALDGGDARRKSLVVTDRGREMTALGATLFNDIRERWTAEIGAEHVDAFEVQLEMLAAVARRSFLE